MWLGSPKAFLLSRVFFFWKPVVPTRDPLYPSSGIAAGHDWGIFQYRIGPDFSFIKPPLIAQLVSFQMTLAKLSTPH